MNIKVGKFPLSANGKALSLSESEGFVKIFLKINWANIRSSFSWCRGNRVN